MDLQITSLTRRRNHCRQLRQTATDTLNRQLRSSISNEDLTTLVIDLWETDRLCIVEEERQTREPQIVCSLGLRTSGA